MQAETFCPASTLPLSASLEEEDSSLPYSTCSSIVATPFGKSDPLIFVGNGRGALYGLGEQKTIFISLKNGGCYDGDKLIGEPCIINPGYFNVTINDVTKFEELHYVGVTSLCIAKFVPNCQFKSVEPGNIIPEVSFPFVRYEEGKSSVQINVSIKGVNSDSTMDMRMDKVQMCVWKGGIVVPVHSQNNCKNLTKNTEKDQLDFTFEYQRYGMQSSTHFDFTTGDEHVGVSVYWERGGVSPDITECKSRLSFV
nr:diagnostic antigen gp50 [Hymenolepis microstoma]